MALQLTAATYRYAGSQSSAIRDVDLVLEPGQVIGIVGPNAAGKSTLCLVAVGLAPGVIGGTLEGEATVDGLNTTEAQAHELCQRAGVLFQEPYNQLSGAVPTVWEEIALGPRNLAMPAKEVARRTWASIEALGIGELIEREPTRLSGGQAQLVALASMLALRPAYLVLDEPTSELDPLGTKLVGDALEQAARATDVGILIVEHKADLLARLCDEVAVLVEGRLVHRGLAQAVLGDERLDEWGVSPPSAERLRRAVKSAGLRWDPSWV